MQCLQASQGKKTANSGWTAFLFNESILHLKDIIQSGDLGEILHLEAHHRNLVP